MLRIELGSCPDPSVVFRRISRLPGAFWLDRTADLGFSTMGFAPSARLAIGADGRAEVEEGGRARRVAGDPLEAAEQFVAAGEALGPDPRVPHTVGFLAYDLGALIEPRIRQRRSPGAGSPLARLARHEAVVVCEPPGGDPALPCRVSVHAASHAAAERCAAELGPLERAIAAPAPPPCAPDRTRLLEAPSRAAYVAAVRRARERIAAGEVYQVNLAQRLRVSSADHPAEVFLRLRREQAVPHAAYLDCGGGLRLLSNSPERFLRVAGELVETAPIKGTRRSDPEPERDAALRAELERDAKERAEHVMIVDLERSDLGRVCEVGSVHVASLMRVESFATVHHLVSTVRGRLRRDVGLAAILRATFPGGSVTGAPKIRATQVIAELEAQPRGIYTGALVWLRGPRDFDSAIAIRTAVGHGGELAYHVGAGIVADSDPEREHEECWLKARPFLCATLGDARSTEVAGDLARSAP